MDRLTERSEHGFVHIKETKRNLGGRNLIRRASVDELVKRLAAYEDSDMMPDEIAALKADRDRWKDRAEEAEVDIHDMLYEARLLMDDALCVWCNKFSVAYNLCLAQEQDCKSECKWRGAEGGGE